MEDSDFTLFGISYKTAIFTACFFVLSYFVFRRNPRIHFHLSRLGTGPRHYPILGSIPHFLFRRPNEYIPMIKEWSENCGGNFGVFWLSNFIPYVAILDPNAVEKVLRNASYANKGKYDYKLIHGWLGTGLLTAPKEKWIGRRKLLAPAFHVKVLEDFLPVFNEQASIFVKCLEKVADKAENFDICPYITNCTLDVICETTMGVKINAQTSPKYQDYIEAVNGMCELLMHKVLRPWLWLPIVNRYSSICMTERKYLHTLKGFTEQIIQAKIEERKQQCNFLPINIDQTEKKRKAFLDLLLDVAENEKSLTNSDIREEVDTFMFAGHDTTAINIAWTVLLIACHPETQIKINEELQSIFEGDMARDITSEDIIKMKYLESCIKESLRLYPSVPYIMREIESDLELDDGRIIPKGVTASLGIYNIHHSKVNFDEPEEFKPERFFENQVKIHPYAYLPFAGGIRNCIGQKFALLEEKIVLAKLLRSYRIETDVKNFKEVPLIVNIMLRPENGINVRLYKRTV